MESKLDLSFVKNFKLDPDPMRLEFQLAVFYPEENKFYKLGSIDYRNYRFDLWGEKMTRWLRFNEAFIFNYTDEDLFDKLYELYKTHPTRIRYRTKEQLLSWFQESTGRIFMMSPEPQELDKGQYNGFYEEKK